MSNEMNTSLSESQESSPAHDNFTPTGTLKKRRKIKWFVAAILLLVLIVGGSVIAYQYQDNIFTNPHYAAGLKNLQAKNYDQAEAEFRLCLEDRPEHRRAKGMLAYAVIRVQLEKNDSKADELKALCLQDFVSYYTQLSTKPMLDNVEDKDCRVWMKDQTTITEKEVRSALKKYNIPFRDWDDMYSSVFAASADLFAIRPDPDDPLDALAKDISAALLLRNGNLKAGAYLMGRCANDDNLLMLTLVAGDQIKKSLTLEAKNKESFIADESQEVLRLLDLCPLLQQFMTDHANIRRMRKGDFPPDQALIFSKDYDIEKQWYNESEEGSTFELFGGIENQLVFINTFEKHKFDPTSIVITTHIIDKNDHTCLTTIGGYDDVSKLYFTRAYYWTGKEWTPLKYTDEGTTLAKSEWAERLPVGNNLNATIDKKTNKILVAIGYRLCKDVTRSSEEVKTRSVTNYRQEYRYNPQLNYDQYSRQWVGGYEYVNVPYLTDEEYVADVKKDERAVGNTWKVFKLDTTNNHLWYVKKEWDENEYQINSDNGGQGT